MEDITEVTGTKIEPPPADPFADAMRAAIAGLFKHRDVTGQIALHPARDMKLRAVIERQAMIMHALALLLDEALAARGAERCIKFAAAPVDRPADGNGAGPALVRP